MSTATIRKSYVDTPLGQLHLRSVEGPGAPVLFLHRTPVTSASFERVLTQLSGWRRLIAFDVPGYGDSFVPAAGTVLPDLVSAFHAALATLGIERFHVVGHHSGASLAAALAQHPGALSLMIDGAMVSSAEERARLTPPPPAPVIDRSGQYTQLAWKFLEPYYTVFDERCIHDEFVGALRSTFTRGAHLLAVRAHDLGATLARLNCPVLACAAEDDVFAAHLERVSAALPRALVRRYGQAGIAGPELQTEAFCALVRETVALGEAG